MKEVRYSIKDLENFTKIKAHTIRIWEQRYKLLAPKRTETNIRYYDESDLKKILNINLLYKNGLKISKIAALTDKEIINKSREILESEEASSFKDIELLIKYIIDFNKTDIDALLRDKLATLQMQGLYEEIIIPLLRRIGELWQVNTLSVAHEHFLSSVIREFILSETHKLDDNVEGLKKAVFFLHEDEQHEFSLLLLHYILKQRGVICYYFGANLPLDELEALKAKIDPDYFVTCFVKQLSANDFKHLLNRIKNIASGSTVIISGAQAELFQSEMAGNIHFISGINEIKRFNLN